MIYGIVKNQHLDLRAKAVADTIDYLTAQFTFLSPDWNGLTVFAHFKQGNDYYSVLLTDGKVTEENHLNLGQGEWEVYLHGNKYENGDVVQRITTNVVKFTVEPTGTLSGEPFPEVEASVVEQIEAQIAELQDEFDSLEDCVYDLAVDNVPFGKSGAALYEIYKSHDKVVKYDGNMVFAATLSNGLAEFYYQVGTETRIFSVNAQGMWGYAADVGEIHIHYNKTVLDKLSDDNGELKYDGSSIGGVTDVQDGNGNSLVSSGIATVPVVQIQENSTTTKFTATEILSMHSQGKVLMFGGYVVTSVVFTGSNKIRIYIGRPTNYDVTYGYSVSFFCYNIENKSISDQLYAGQTIDDATLTKARNMTSISFLIVQTLPTQNIQTNIIYLVPSTDPQTRNTYDEFIYIQSTSSWEQIGSTAVDLTGYATESWVQSQGYVTSAVTDVQDSEGNSLVTSGVATIPEIPEVPTDEEMATVLADFTDFVTINGVYFGDSDIISI